MERCFDWGNGSGGSCGELLGPRVLGASARGVLGQGTGMFRLPGHLTIMRRSACCNMTADISRPFGAAGFQETRPVSAVLLRAPVDAVTGINRAASASVIRILGALRFRARVCGISAPSLLESLPV